MIEGANLLAYIAKRHAGVRAIEALAHARLHPACAGYNMFNPPSEISRQPKRPTYAWVSNTDANGLRFVDYADKLAGSRAIEHTGWYTDEDGDNGMLFRGAVYRLPHSRGFVAGYADPWNDGSAFVELSTYPDAREAAFPADSLAQYEAERERDYQAAWQAGSEYRDLADEIGTARKQCLALIREAKAACAVLTDFAAIKETIREHVTSYRADIAKARRRRAELLDQFGSEKGFNDA